MLDLVKNVDTEQNAEKWMKNSFIHPLCILLELSGFPCLLSLYKNLVTIPVTSCSAERSMSKLKIVKNRLRSTMKDDWLESLMILASEQDLLDSLSPSSIIDKFAFMSPNLRKLLIFA
jgi:hypothetical protein